jgi:hypothetical protein
LVIVPQAPAAVLLQATDQETPAFEVSLLTTAVSRLVASGVSAAGVAVTATEIDEAVTVAPTLAVTAVVFADAVAVAVIVTGLTPVALLGAV